LEELAALKRTVAAQRDEIALGIIISKRQIVRTMRNRFRKQLTPPDKQLASRCRVRARPAMPSCRAATTPPRSEASRPGSSAAAAHH
jgi:hypothetical protein